VDASDQFELGIKLDGVVKNLEEHRTHALLHGEHPGVFCRMYRSWALWLLGYPDQAVHTANAALDLGEFLGEAFSTAVAASFAAVLHNWRHEFTIARMRAERAIELASKHHLRRIGLGMMASGVALVGLGQQDQGIAQLRTGLEDYNEMRARISETQWLGLIAEAHVRAGQFDDALTALDQAAGSAAETGECHYQAELHRLRGEILTETGEDSEALSWFQRAMDIARNQQAKSLELRAATSLARLWRDQGKPVEAQELLAPVYGWFTEGFDTADLKDAKALLEELA
jgi:predicted ATPase